MIKTSDVANNEAWALHKLRNRIASVVSGYDALLVSQALAEVFYDAIKAGGGGIEDANGILGIVHEMRTAQPDPASRPTAEQPQEVTP